MKIIVPTTITEAMVVSSTVAEPDTALGETAWSATTIYAEGDERYVGAPSSTVTITNASPGVITWAANGLAVDTPVVFSTSGSLPSGLTAGDTYFVRSRLTADTFTVSATKGGRPISTTSAGSGTHTATAKVHRVYEALATAGSKSTVTITIASPGVVTWTSHGLAAGTPIVFTTTGALPTGITAGTTYYIISTGLGTNSFQFSDTEGGAAVNTSGSQSGTHTAGLAAGYNKPPAINSTVWEHVGSTNKWAAFDQQGGTVTTADGEIEMVLTPGRFNAFFIRGLDADSLTITVDLPGSPVQNVYTYTLDLTGGVSVGNWYEYFYDPIYQTDTVTQTELVDATIFYLPAFADCILTITITRTGGQVQVGTIVVGIYETLGTTVDQPSVEIIDDSTKETDSRGNTTLEEGPYRDRMSLEVKLDAADFDNVKRIMTTYRATAVVWIAAEGVYDSMSLYGFWTRWRLTAAGPNHSLLSADIESL